jgi:hypothetical protein
MPASNNRRGHQKGTITLYRAIIFNSVYFSRKPSVNKPVFLKKPGKTKQETYAVSNALSGIRVILQFAEGK